MHSLISKRAARFSSLLFFLTGSLFIHAQIPMPAAPNGSEVPETLPSAPTTPAEPTNVIEQLIQLIDEDPSDWRSQNKLAVAYANSGENELALPLLDSAVGLAPREASLYYNLAVVYSHLHRPQDALSSAQRALNLNAADPNARRIACDLKLELKKYRDSAKCYGTIDQLNRRDPTFFSAYTVALAYSGSVKQALKTAEEGLRQHPDEIGIIHSYGITYFLKKDYRRAAEQFQRVVRRDPTSVIPRFNLALAALMNNDRTAAFDQYNALRATDPSIAQQLRRELEKKFLLTISPGSNSETAAR